LVCELILETTKASNVSEMVNYFFTKVLIGNRNPVRYARIDHQLYAREHVRVCCFSKSRL